MSSRVCVKNLPRKCTESRLREHFASQGGEITDLRIMRKADGSSRMFGFVGYKTDKMAAAACKYFNSTFIGTVRIAVELARTRGDEELARPWSKHSKGSSAFERVQAHAAGTPEADRGAEADGEEQRRAAGRARARSEDDPKLREYLALMRPKGSAGKFWAADGDVAGAAADAADAGKEREARRPLKSVTKQLQVPNRKPGGEGQVVTKTHLTFDDGEDDHAESDDEYQMPALAGGVRAGAAEGGAAGAGGAHAAKAQAMSDLDYLRSKQKAASLSDDEEEDEDEEEGEEAGAEVADGREVGEGEEASEDEEEVGEAQAAETDADADAATAAARADEADLSETGRLFVRNLSYDVTDDELKALCASFGPLADVLVPVDGTTKRGKGFAYVQYMLPEHAVRALAKLDGSIFQGRIIHLLPAHLPPAAARKADGEGGATGFKSAREEERRAGAQLPTSWNSLFMGADAVASATAEGLGLSKAALLGPDAEDAAVRLALGETTIVAATKAWFRTHGLNARALDALDAAREAAASAGRADIARSRTVVLVKNLPAGAREAWLQSALHAQFGRYGTVSRLMLPPARTLALVEFAAIPEARRAFAGMAYRKLAEGQAPLYLEWAPQKLMEGEGEGEEEGARASAAGAAGVGEGRAGEEDEEEEKEDGVESGRGRVVGAQRARGAAADGAGGAAAAAAADAAADEGSKGEGAEADGASLAGHGCSVYVKNLSFASDEPKLRALFEKRFPAFPLKSVVIARKADRKTPGKWLSMGYGFVEFGSREHARDVVKAATSAARPLTLDEHALALSLSTHSAGARPAAAGAAAARRAPAARGKPSRKLTVRNVPFEASKKEMRQLFASFGELQSVRLPKKFDGKHRGFAFIEYLSKQDAAKAMEALGNTHLYGRHLVLEWAAEEHGVEALREKAKRHLDASQRAADAKRLRADGADELGFDRDADAGLEDQMIAY